MCLIINRERGQTITDEFARDVAKRNADGWGFMYNSPKTNQVIVKKGLVLEDFFTNFRPVQEKNIPCVIHFRYKTHGAVSLENCHPYEVVRGVYFMHNGTIDVTIPKKDVGKLSDTATFVRDVLRPMLLTLKDRTSAMRTQWFTHFMEAHADSHNSRYVLMDEEGSLFYGSWYPNTKNIWCSNNYAYDLDNPTKKTYTPPPSPSYDRRTGLWGNGYEDYEYFGDASYAESSTTNKNRAEEFKKKDSETNEQYIDRINKITGTTELKQAIGETTVEFEARVRKSKEIQAKLKDTVNTVNQNKDFNQERKPAESAITFYRRIGLTSQNWRAKVVGETVEEFEARMKGDFDSLVALPYNLNSVVVGDMALENGASYTEMEKEIRLDRYMATEYFKKLKIVAERNNKEATIKKEEEKSAELPKSPSQSTEVTNETGNLKASATHLTLVSPDKSGNDYTSQHGKLQKKTQEDPNSETREDKLDDFTTGLEDDDKLNSVIENAYDPSMGDFSGMSNYIDMMDAFNGDDNNSEETLIEYLEQKLEREIENFEMVAEQDWFLDPMVIEDVVKRITTGELSFKYDESGMSTLSNSEGVIYPDFLANKVSKL